ncbi:MAG: nuclear transport factor 2 family protein [Albidovulum sp.]|nr:nuclear transport factor 2 family protein [Albidovulum sp.]
MTEQLPRYTDFCDYILGITEEIWERRKVDSLRRYYSEGIFVRSPTGIVVGHESVIASTCATLAELPDRRLLGEDVIWARMGEDSWLSSHRLFSTATHLGNGQYGAATGTKLAYRTIADCHAHACEVSGWQIDDEWLIRDQGAIVRQLGSDPRTFAMESIDREGGFESCARPFSPGGFDGPYRGDGNNDETGIRYADMLSRIMHADLAVVSTEYDRACHLEHPGGKTAHGRSAADSFWLGLRSSFPAAEFKIDHATGLSEQGMPRRAAVRWSLAGAHDGFGMFGAPTGADVYVMGASHAEFGPRGIRREYVVLDETAIWKQILIHVG